MCTHVYIPGFQTDKHILDWRQDVSFISLPAWTLAHAVILTAEIPAVLNPEELQYIEANTVFQCIY